MADPTSHPPIFIVGNDRSGTTMLRLMLDRDPELAIPTESMIVSDFAHVRRDGDRLAADAEAVRFARRVWEHPKVRLWGIPGKPPIPPEGLGHDDAYRFALEAPYRAYAEEFGASRWGDKTPSYLHHIDELLAVWPAARIVVLVRDARDVGMSIQRLPFGANNALVAAREWVEGIRAGLAAAERYPDSILHVRYEDLVADPAARLREVCAFVGIEYRDELLAIEETDTSRLVDSQQDWFTNVFAGINQKSVGKWKRGMSLSDQRIYAAVATDELERFGYEITDEARSDGVAPLDRVLLEAHHGVLKVSNFVRLRLVQERGREVRYVIRRKLGARR